MCERSRDERGSAGVEAGIAVTSLMLMMFLIVGGLRVSGTRGDVEAAARFAARAASHSYGQSSGTSAAEAVAFDALAERGVACVDLVVVATGDWSPGGFTSVTVACEVDLSDVVLGGFPGSLTVTGDGYEVVDTIRGGE